MQLTNLTSQLLQQHAHSQQARDLAAILNQIVFGGKLISRDINKAGLVDILGATGRTNIQAEAVQKLDEHANTILVSLLSELPQVRAIGSEEVDELITLDQHSATGQYLVLLDPLDGSSNIDVNVAVGTIFTILTLPRGLKRVRPQDYLVSPPPILAAGYILYGSSTMLVYSSGQGVHGFTLDPSIGEFLLSHPHLKLSPTGSIYSINESYAPNWTPEFRAYIESLKTSQNAGGKPKSARYIGTLVADFHRNLLKGGIFLYPADSKHPEGKLRLLYEAWPFAYLAEQAGGAATNGQSRILELKPNNLHQRTALVVGPKKDVKEVRGL